MRIVAAQRPTQDSYFDLVRAFPLRPIHSEKDLSRATTVLVQLTKSKPEDKMDDGERD